MKLFITFFHKHLSLHVFVHPSIPAEQQFLFNASYRFFFINLIIDSKRVLQTRSIINFDHINLWRLSGYCARKIPLTSKLNFIFLSNIFEYLTILNFYPLYNLIINDVRKKKKKKFQSKTETHFLAEHVQHNLFEAS